MMERHIPSDITSGEKKGFSGPDSSWFKGESIDYVKRTLYNPNANINEYINPELLKNMVDKHLKGKENRRLLIWSLLSLEKWCESFLAAKR
jgi:asparagine synthase (glutamine-hydrolysing)